MVVSGGLALISNGYTKLICFKGGNKWKLGSVSQSQKYKTAQEKNSGLFSIKVKPWRQRLHERLPHQRYLHLVFHARDHE